MSTTFPSSWPTWLKELFGWTPPAPLYQPTYQPAQFVTEPGAGGSVGKQILNAQYFVTKDTAQTLATLYGATVKAEPYEGAVGPDKSTATEYHLVFADGLDVNAGELAFYYKPCGPNANPNGTDPTLPAGSPNSGVSSPATVDNPDLAVTECNAVLANARLDMAGKTR